MSSPTERRSGQERRTQARRFWHRWKNTIAFLALAISCFFAVYRGEDARKDYQNALARSGTAQLIVGCNRDFRTNQKVRAVFVRGQGSVVRQYENHQINKAQYEIGKAFYEEQIKSFDAPDCRGLKITASKSAKIVIPTPLFVGSPFEFKALPGEKDPPVVP